MSVVLKIVGFFAPTPEHVVEHIGKYLVEFNFEAGFGKFVAKTTPDIKKAKLFANGGEALEFWRQRSTTQPNRPNDGRPNRPLTAASVEIVSVPDVDSSSPA